MEIIQFKPFVLLLILSSCASSSNARNLKQRLEEIREKNSLPGLTAALFVDGSLKSLSAVGVRKVGFDDKLTEDDKFHIGSCSKSITAMLAATFVDENKVKWKSRLSEFFPELKLHSELKDVKFEDLLAHRSGLINNPEEKWFTKLGQLEVMEAREELAKVLLTQKPAFKPYSFNYSNSGYIIAGHILERISKKSWETLITERIFQPLEMNSCGFGLTSDPEESIPTQPWGHFDIDDVFFASQGDNPPYYGPSGSIHCNLKDWAKFLNVHVEGFNGSSKLISVESLKKLHSTYPEEGSDYTYGGWLQLERSWARGMVLTHAGSNVSNYANVWLAPEKKAILISTTNSGGESARQATNDVIVELILSEL